jgi:hypothetical protein
MRPPSGKGLVATVAFLAVLGSLALAVACGGGDDSPDVDIKDFDTAAFTMTRTVRGQQTSGEGVVDNRKQALSVTYANGLQYVGIGHTSYSSVAGRWVASTDAADSRAGLARPYWPEFWRDAVDIAQLAEAQGAEKEIDGYLLTLDPNAVKKNLSPGLTGPSGEEPEVRRAEVQVVVDSETRYVKEFEFRLEIALGGNSLEVEVSSKFSDYGTEVRIEPPEGPAPTAIPPAESPPAEPLPTEPVALPQG